MTHVLDLAEKLPKYNIQAEILFFTKGPSIDEARKKKIPVHLILKKGRGLIFLYNLYKFLKKNRYDVLHTHTINGNFYGRLSGKLSNIPVLLTTVHSHIIDELKGLKKPSLLDHFRYRIDLFFARWSKALIVVSENIHERLIGHGIPAKKIYVIENGVDTSKFKPSYQTGIDVRKELGISVKAKVVGIIGRMVPLKNHDFFLDTAKEVLRERENACFLIVGDGPLKNHIQSYAYSLGLREHVIFTGWRNDIERIITALDILVLCSQVEGHNVVILEAMSCEKPVIGTDVRGIHSTIRNNENGVLVPLGDSTALAKAILFLFNNPEKAKSMGDAGRKYIQKKHSIDRMVSAYINLYQDLSIQ